MVSSIIIMLCVVERSAEDVSDQVGLRLSCTGIPNEQKRVHT